MGRKLHDLTGMIFNELTVIEIDAKSPGKDTKWICQIKGLASGIVKPYNGSIY